MNTKQTSQFLIALINQLFNHGWAEDYKDHIACNDVYNLFQAIAEGKSGAEINSLIDCTRWDEEYDFKYDDGGLTSFAIEVTKLLRKFNVIDESERAVLPVSVSKTIKYYYKCPHCGAGNSNMEAETVKCTSCKNPIKLNNYKEFTNEHHKES